MRGNAVKDLSSCFHRVFRSPFSPGKGEKVAEGRMRGLFAGSDAIKFLAALPVGVECVWKGYGSRHGMKPEGSLGFQKLTHRQHLLKSQQTRIHMKEQHWLLAHASGPEAAGASGPAQT